MVKLGIIMDAVTSINTKKDTSSAILIEAQSRGYEIHYMETHDIYLSNSEAWAYTRIISLNQNVDSQINYIFKSEYNHQMLSNFDVILMRKDPPFNMEYIYVTYCLEHAEKKGTLIVNKPQSLRDCNEKIFATWFNDFTPATLVTCSQKNIQDFRDKYHDIILKPLDNMGGYSIFRVKNNDPNSSVIINSMTSNGTQFCMAQEYLSSIEYGDKRVLIVDGEIVPYCLARIPKDGETRGNLTAGGYGRPQLLEKTDWDIARHVAPILKSKGLMFVGLDIIGTRLTEINVTSPTGVREIEAVFPISITGMLLNAIEQHLDK